MTKVNRSRSLRAAVVAGVMALLLGPAAAAQAAVVPVFFSLTGGALTIGELDVEIPTDAGASLSGNWDDESGAFEGSLNIPGFSIELGPEDTGLPLTVELDIAITTGPVTGTVPPDGLVGSVSTSLTVTVGVALLGLTCSLGPVELTLDTVLEELDGDVILTASGAGFSIPAATCSDEALAGTVNDALGLPNSETSIVLIGVLGEAPDIDPEPVTPEEVEEIVEARPAFTG